MRKYLTALVVLAALAAPAQAQNQQQMAQALLNAATGGYNLNLVPLYNAWRAQLNVSNTNATKAVASANNLLPVMAPADVQQVQAILAAMQLQTKILALDATTLDGDNFDCALDVDNATTAFNQGNWAATIAFSNFFLNADGPQFGTDLQAALTDLGNYNTSITALQNINAKYGG